MLTLCLLKSIIHGHRCITCLLKKLQPKLITLPFEGLQNSLKPIKNTCLIGAIKDSVHKNEGEEVQRKWRNVTKKLLKLNVMAKQMFASMVSPCGFFLNPHIPKHTITGGET